MVSNAGSRCVVRKTWEFRDEFYAVEESPDICGRPTGHNTGYPVHHASASSIQQLIRRCISSGFAFLERT